MRLTSNDSLWFRNYSAFTTHPDETNFLHVEVGSHHITCWCTGNETSFTALEYFTFTYDATEGAFVDVFRELKRRSILLNHTFASEEIVWENADFMCVPKDLFQEETAVAYMNLVNSQSFQSAPMHDAINDCMLTFTANSILYKIVKENLPRASHTHKLHHLLQRHKTEKDSLQIQFYQTHFLLTAIRNGTLQLATVYRFKTPQEAVYHILNSLDKLKMLAAETITLVSGFIDETSALYKEIRLYVNNLQFAENGQMKEGYPMHYFTSYNLPLA